MKAFCILFMVVQIVFIFEYRRINICWFTLNDYEKFQFMHWLLISDFPYQKPFLDHLQCLRNGNDNIPYIFRHNKLEKHPFDLRWGMLFSILNENQWSFEHIYTFFTFSISKITFSNGISLQPLIANKCIKIAIFTANFSKKFPNVITTFENRVNIKSLATKISKFADKKKSGFIFGGLCS